jgi:chloramphenicol O-acetyltransferase
MSSKLEARRDRFEHFERMENPSINLTFTLELPDHRPWCKAKGYPPFHVLYFAVWKAIMQVENFRYRIYQGDVIEVDFVYPSYTVMNFNNDLNFTEFEPIYELEDFIRRSLQARDAAMASPTLQLPWTLFDERELCNHVFTTCIPWLDFTSIQHPMARFGSANIPLIAWGKIRDTGPGRIAMPFSINAHHGFVDGYHMHLLAQEINQQLLALISV